MAAELDEAAAAAIAELTMLPTDSPKLRKRPICDRCKRPDSVCICSCFPPEPVPIQTRVIILQHPHEESRCLATVPLLQQCVPRDRCYVFRGKRFSPGKTKVLDRALASPNSLLLFPGKTAVDLQRMPPEPVGLRDDAALIVLDGTWAQAKTLYSQSHALHTLRQVQLSCDFTSEYTIRTQPTRGSLSTLESVAHALAWFDHNPDIVELLVSPLRAMCQYQLDHGAVIHHSKDDPGHIPRRLKLQWKCAERMRVAEQIAGTDPNETPSTATSRSIPVGSSQ